MLLFYYKVIRDDPNPLLFNEAFFINPVGGKWRMKWKVLYSYNISKKVNLKFFSAYL